MAIPAEQAYLVLAELENSAITNLFAQAHAKHVLHEVREVPENFPAFDRDLDDKVTFTAYAMLAAGCSLVEQEERSRGVSALEKAASLLQYVHGPHLTESRESAFQLLVASMAFYAAGHYSRAFVSIRGAEEQTDAARVIAAFLRKDVTSLIQRLTEVLLRDHPEFDDELNLNEWAITVAISRAVAITLEFIFTGSENYLRNADQQLQDAAILATAGDHPSWWWIVRLLRLMLRDLGDSSPWRILPSYFDPNSSRILGHYVRLLAFAKRPVMELWNSQRAALPLALDLSNGGAVVNLRTSAGKTRVAELAILRTLASDFGARIFYLAPFRSLALEIEETLTSTFSWLGYQVSHLYGGSRVSSVDTELAADSTIMIATPEKARALFRSVPDLFENLKLLIIDEGHLIGPSERYVRNEVFVDHLRCITRATGARVLLLSAVLPNPQELAEWVTGDANSVARSDWKPSAERFGLLRWNGSRMRIDWKGEVASFNPSFVEAKPLGFGRRRKPFPNNKTEAVAASAVRLSRIGPVMIFTGRAVSVPTIAEAVLLALGEKPEDHAWPEREWRVFDAVCREDLDPDAIEVRAARSGIVCHSNRLTPQVRLALEHLMRARAPRIIIATTTLAQGVNIGISSIIIATPYISKETIDKRDFWNICGRAGRAFVDGEGKILYAIDDTKDDWHIKKDEKLARIYFDAGTSDPVESGILFIVGLLKRIAATAGVSFDLLLELAANNDFSILGDKAEDFGEICDLFDDELLALHEDPLANPNAEDPINWVERVFRDSLAVIQACSELSGIESGDVLAFLRARAQSTLLRVTEPTRRKSVVSSGLPLSVALRANAALDIFRAIADHLLESVGELSELAAAVHQIEEWARTNAGSVVADEMPDESLLDALRTGWLSGVSLRKLCEIDDKAKLICKDLYGYQLPWLAHAASQQIRSADEDERAEALATIALLLELGVPNEKAARIFLAGVRSRTAAVELAALDVDFGSSVSGITRRLRNAAFADQVRPLVSPDTAGWLDLMVTAVAGIMEPAPEFPPFSLSGSEMIDVLHTRKLGDRLFLCTVDGLKRFQVSATDELRFDRVANDPRIAFVRQNTTWHIAIRDPRLTAE